MSQINPLHNLPSLVEKVIEGGNNSVGSFVFPKEPDTGIGHISVIALLDERTSSPVSPWLARDLGMVSEPGKDIARI